MAGFDSLQSPTTKYIKPISSIFFNNCPKLFSLMTPDSQLLMSPTSILDSIPFSGFKNPFSSESITPKSNPEPDHNRRLWSSNSDKVGLSNILEEQDTKCSKHETRMVLFGSQLKIQIPLQPYYSKDYGIKTRACSTRAQIDQHCCLPDDFLNRCYTCRKDLSVGEDIYMYKGEKAFCSNECRYEVMRLDED